MNILIFSWEEIWKLKNLPKLESLILSGNPIQYIFYKENENCSICSQDNTNENTENEGDVSMEMQDLVDDIVYDVIRLTESAVTEEADKDSQCVDCQHGNPFSRLKLICLSDTQLNNWTHCGELRKYPALESLRIKVLTISQIWKMNNSYFQTKCDH